VEAEDRGRQTAPVALLESALGWVERHLDQFVMTGRRINFVYTVKPLAELGLLGETLSRTRDAQRGRRLLEHAWAQLRQGRLLLALINSGPTFLVQSVMYAPFYRSGLRNRALELAIAANAASSPVPPSHRLTLATVLLQLGLPLPWSIAELVDADWAQHLQKPLSLTATDLYVATHAVFNVTDYGRQRDALPAPQRDMLRHYLPQWLAALARQQQLDLTAELVLAWHCLEDRCVAPEAWAALAAGQRADGAVIFAADDRRPLELDLTEATRRDWYRVYHTTLVTVLCACLCTHGAT
jgi:hypothetical protein